MYKFVDFYLGQVQVLTSVDQGFRYARVAITSVNIHHQIVFAYAVKNYKLFKTGCNIVETTLWRQHCS